MAFPTTSILTGFDGADEEPLSEQGRSRRDQGCGAWSGSMIRESTRSTAEPVNAVAAEEDPSAVGFWTGGPADTTS